MRTGAQENKKLKNDNKKPIDRLKLIVLISLVLSCILMAVSTALVKIVPPEKAKALVEEEKKETYIDLSSILSGFQYEDLLHYLVENNEALHKIEGLAEKTFYEEISKQPAQKTMDKFAPVFKTLFVFSILSLVFFAFSFVAVLLVVLNKIKSDFMFLTLLYFLAIFAMLIVIGAVTSFATESIKIEIGVGLWLAFILNIANSILIITTYIKDKKKNSVE